MSNVNKCAVPGRKNHGCHRLPKVKIRRASWNKAIQHGNRFIKRSKISRISSAHFQVADVSLTPSYWHNYHTAWRYLKRTAVPSLFPWNITSREQQTRAAPLFPCKLAFWDQQGPSSARDPAARSGFMKLLEKLFFIPQRYVLAIMAALAIANAYTMRVCLNLAITQMVKKAAHLTEDPYDDLVCPDLRPNVTKVFGQNDVRFDWSELQQGILLGAFYYGYVVTHIPGGMMAERYGGKWVLGLGLLSTAVCTLLTPVTVTMGGATALFILRVIEGLGEGPTMPGLMSMLSKWAPAEERGRMGAIVFGGAQIGNIAGAFFSGLIMHNGTWQNVFYLFGGLGMIWFIVWVFICFSTPNTHPFISESERQFLNENVDSLKHTEKNRLAPTPWKALLRSVPLWALIIAAIGHDWGYFTMITDLPKYMTDVLKFNIKSTGTLSSLPYVAMWISSFIFGLICDFLIKKKIHSITTARKLYTTIAATGPGICIILASYSGCNTTMAVVWFVIAMTLMGSYYSGMKVNPLDIAPNFAGTATAIVNGIAAIAGIISPYLIGLLTPDSTLKQWRVAFWVCLFILVSTNIVYLIFAEAKQAWWDDVKTHGYPADWKHGPLPTHSTQNIRAE